MESIPARVLKRIRVHGRGWVFTPGQFLDLGNADAVLHALTRFTQANVIRRLARGIYDYPRTHKKLGVLLPNPDEVASAMAARTGSRVQASGARAANLMGLTEQVPARMIYLTDGPPRRVKIGAQTIELRRASPSKFPGVGTPAGLALQAITAAGPKANKDFVFRQLSRALRPEDKLQLIGLKRYAPGWSHEIIQRLKTT